MTEYRHMMRILGDRDHRGILVLCEIVEGNPRPLIEFGFGARLTRALEDGYISEEFSWVGRETDPCTRALTFLDRCGIPHRFIGTQAVGDIREIGYRLAERLMCRLGFWCPAECANDRWRARLRRHCPKLYEGETP